MVSQQHIQRGGYTRLVNADDLRRYGIDRQGVSRLPAHGQVPGRPASALPSTQLSLPHILPTTLYDTHATTRVGEAPPEPVLSSAQLPASDFSVDVSDPALFSLVAEIPESPLPAANAPGFESEAGAGPDDPWMSLGSLLGQGGMGAVREVKIYPEGGEYILY